MSIDLEERFQQTTHTRDGVERWFVITDKTGPLQVHSIAKTEMEQFLEGLEFRHLVGQIPRFYNPIKQGKWKNPLEKPDVNS